MRKVLALTLAAVLALGIFGFAMAVPYDIAGTGLEGAVSKLACLDIIDGFPDGTYRPADIVTRGQFAKIIVTALGVGQAAQYAAGITRFSDVLADHWAAGYINVAVDLGIIAGYPDGTFMPENPVTYAEAIKMIVAALGYNPKAEAMGGYPGGYLAIAAEKEITEGITVVGNLAANRGDIALMINNSLDVDMMVQTTWGQFPEYAEKEGETFLKKLGVEEREGRVTEIPRINNRLDDNEIKINGKVYQVVDGIDLERVFGNRVTALVKKDKVIGLTIESDFFIDAIELEDDKLKLVENGEEYDLAEKKDEGVITIVYIDGEKKTAAHLGDAYDYARVILDDDGDVIFIDAYNWDGFIVVEGIDDKVLFGYGDELDIENFVIVKDGKAVTANDIKKGDIFFFNEDAEFGEIYNASFTDVISRVYSTSFKVEGEEIDIVSGYSKYLDGKSLEDFDADIAECIMDEGEEATVFVNRWGEAVFVIGDTGEAQTSSFYAYVIEESVDTPYSIRNKSYYNLDVLNDKGKELNYDIKVADALAWNIANLEIGNIVKIEVDRDGDIKHVTPLAADANNRMFEADDGYVAGFRLQNNAVVFNVEDVSFADFDTDDIVVGTLGSVDFDVAKGDIYVDDAKVVVIVVKESDRKADEEVIVAVATSDAKAIKGTDMFELKVSVEGIKKTYDTRDKAALAAVAEDVYEGAFVKLSVDQKTNQVVDIVILEDAGEPESIISGYKIEGKNNNNATLLTAGGAVKYRLSNATILDAEDNYKVLRMRDLTIGDTVNILLVQEGSQWAIYVVRTEKVK